MRYLISVLFAPRKTFELVREKVDWVSPVLVLGLLNTVFVMIGVGSDVTLSALVMAYGMAVLQICLTMLLFGLILIGIKSMLKATEGTFWQLCKVKLFSTAPLFLLLLWKILLVLVLGEAIAETALVVVNMILVAVTSVWSLYLLVLGAAVTIGKSGMEIFVRLVIIWLVFLAISLLFSL